MYKTKLLNPPKPYRAQAWVGVARVQDPDVAQAPSCLPLARHWRITPERMMRRTYPMRPRSEVDILMSKIMWTELCGEEQ